MTAVVRDARPPLLAIRLLNSVLRNVLRTPLGRVAPPLALLEFAGRRSKTIYRVVVAWHHVDDNPLVLTPAAWRANFIDGAPVTVHRRGQHLRYHGVLDLEPDNVAAAINAMLDAGTSARSLALDIPGGHRVTRDDVEAVARALIWLRPVTPAQSLEPARTGNRSEQPR